MPTRGTRRSPPLYNASGGIPEPLANVMAEAGGTAVRRGRFRPLHPDAGGEVSRPRARRQVVAMSLRRQNVPHLLEKASGNSNVHVVVIDGGPMLDAASTVQLCQLVDVVVLAVPPRTWGSGSVTSRAAGESAGEVPPVLTAPHRRRFLPNGPPRTASCDAGGR